MIRTQWGCLKLTAAERFLGDEMEENDRRDTVDKVLDAVEPILDATEKLDRAKTRFERFLMVAAAVFLGVMCLVFPFWIPETRDRLPLYGWLLSSLVAFVLAGVMWRFFGRVAEAEKSQEEDEE